MKPRSKAIGVGVGLWLIFVLSWAGMYAGQMIASPLTVPGYEKSWAFQLAMFFSLYGVYLIAGLGLVIVLTYYWPDRNPVRE